MSAPGVRGRKTPWQSPDKVVSEMPELLDAATEPSRGAQGDAKKVARPTASGQERSKMAHVCP
eukprot:8966494-Pyramimonas_sp.AAC.1